MDKRWIKRAQLSGLAVIGISAVSIPVTIAFMLSATTGGSPLVLGTPNRARTVHKNPARAITQALKCAPTKGYYALTFDDGPYPETTERLVGALAGAGAVATFFNIGQRVDAHPELVQLQRSVGQVANHSYTHPHLPAVSQERRFQELTETAKALDRPNAFFRPPFGETSPATDADIRKTGLVPVYWTTDTYDWQRPPVDVIVRRALEVQPEGIVLLHDGRENTIQAVPRIVSELRSRGMCPGLLARTDKTVVSVFKQTTFNVVAVSPKNDSGVVASRSRARRAPTAAMNTATIILLVPAHNEEVGIVATMESVEAQTLRPDRRIVICDNCTDATPALARSRPGWEVWESVGNTGKKGGALNQAWDRLTDDLTDDDFLVTMDADTLLDAHFVENAFAKYQEKHIKGHKLGGVCANFHGIELDSALGVLQMMEYARAEKINRSRRGRAPVLAGAAAMFSVRGLREVYDSRGSALQAGPDRGLRALPRTASAWL